MKNLFFLWLFIFNGEAFGQQRKDTVVAELDFSSRIAAAIITNASNSMFIGNYACLGCWDIRYSVIIGDFLGVNTWPSYTLHFDRNFEYFKTRKGKALLRYLRRQPRKLSKELSLTIQDYIKENYLADMLEFLNNRIGTDHSKNVIISSSMNFKSQPYDPVNR